jgi:nicotinamidase-related amidase
MIFLHTKKWICRKQIRTIILCGVQTPNCIRASAFDGISLDYNVIVSSDATASASKQVQDANLHGEVTFHLFFSDIPVR